MELLVLSTPSLRNWGLLMSLCLLEGMWVCGHGIIDWKECFKVVSLTVCNLGIQQTQISYLLTLLRLKMPPFHLKMEVCLV